MGRRAEGLEGRVDGGAAGWRRGVSGARRATALLKLCC